ncbi:MAG: IS607 family transposase [Pseudomonadota bacterium]
MSHYYRINEFAKRVGRTPSTIRRWERDGKLQSKRLPSGHRYFDESDIRRVLGGAAGKRLTVVYCRVSSAGQKKDLATQVEAMEGYCRGAGIAVDEWIQEIGGGLNFKRKQFLNLLERIMRGEVSQLLVAHKDRLMRFGFDCFAHIASVNGCALVVVNQESFSPQQEVVEDLMAIVHTFSCRLSVMRKYQDQIKEDYPESTKKKPEVCE